MEKRKPMNPLYLTRIYLGRDTWNKIEETEVLREYDETNQEKVHFLTISSTKCTWTKKSDRQGKSKIDPATKTKSKVHFSLHCEKTGDFDDRRKCDESDTNAQQ